MNRRKSAFWSWNIAGNIMSVPCCLTIAPSVRGFARSCNSISVDRLKTSAIWRFVEWRNRGLTLFTGTPSEQRLLLENERYISTLEMTGMERFPLVTRLVKPDASPSTQPAYQGSSLRLYRLRSGKRLAVTPGFGGSKKASNRA